MVPVIIPLLGCEWCGNKTCVMEAGGAPHGARRKELFWESESFWEEILGTKS